jgi:excisionase family DNA binding protein
MQVYDTPATQNINPDPLLSMKEAANYLGISISKMYDLAKREKLSVVKVTSDRKIRKSVLDSYIKRCESTWRWGNIYSTNNSKEIA